METNNQAQQPINELTLIKAKQESEFMLTPVGQQVRQFEMQQRMAQMYAQSTIIPETYRGNLGNCVIALDMAMRMGANPLMVMQNLYIVHGTPSFSSKFLVASVNASGRYTTLAYEWKGQPNTPEWGCRCYAYEKGDTKKGNRLEGVWVDMKMAEAEGWTKKSGSKWLTMPQQMLIYRAAAFWQRAYCPEISMGFISTEEAEDAPVTIKGEFPEVITAVAEEVNDNAGKAGEMSFEATEPAQEESQQEQQEPQKAPQPAPQPAQRTRPTM